MVLPVFVNAEWFNPPHYSDLLNGHTRLKMKFELNLYQASKLTERNIHEQPSKLPYQKSTHLFSKKLLVANCDLNLQNLRNCATWVEKIETFADTVQALCMFP